MKRTGLIPLALSFVAVAACADKPASSASSTETTSARYPDSTMSSNVNDTSATGAATNESPYYASQNKPVQNKPVTPPTTAHLRSATTTSGTSTTAAPPTWGNRNTNYNNGRSTTGTTRADDAVPAHDQNLSADASSTNGTYDRSAGAPGATPPAPPQNAAPKVTPISQGNNSRDLKMTAAIRREIISNGDLSFTAKNVKIITNGGHVTLKGEVKSQQERDAIEGTAIRVAGVANVDDQIVVKP